MVGGLGRGPRKGTRARPPGASRRYFFFWSWGTTTVVLGTADQIDQKLLAVQMVAARVAADHKRLLRVDVRAPDRPAAQIS